MNKIILPVVAAVVGLGVAAQAKPSKKEALMNPANATAQAPKTFKVRFTTTKGNFTIEARREWAPHGADRFYNLIKLGYFDDTAFFRAINGFMVQFGINGTPAVNQKWREARIPDDPQVGESNTRGMVTFATAGPNSRTTQLFINYGDNSRLDSMGFTPFGKVIEGFEIVDGLNKEYGEGAPRGAGPDQGRVQAEGNAYLKKEFPRLDYVKTAQLIAAPAPAK